MSLLFSDEELAAMAVRYAQRQVKQSPPTPPPPTLPPGFVYAPRSQAQWHRRAHQSRENFLLEPEPLKPTRAKAKALVENSPCTCGHPYGNHDRSHPSYPPLKETFAAGDCSLITTPCRVNTGCDCWNFVDAETGKAAKLKRPQVLPHVLCKKCGHAREDHCTSHKATKIRKPGEWEGFKRDGLAAACQHTTMAVWYRCNSTSCAAAVGEEFCPCVKFVSPLTLPKVTPASRKKRATVCQGASPEVAATNSITEPVPAKPRRTRKKKTAFVTDAPELFPPASANP
jgi:hypothetical protein